MWGRKRDTEAEDRARVPEADALLTKFAECWDRIPAEDRLAFVKRFNEAPPEEIRAALDARKVDDRDICDDCETARAIQEGFEKLNTTISAEVEGLIQDAFEVVDADERRVNGFEHIANTIEKAVLLKHKVVGLNELRKEFEDKIAELTHKMNTRMGTLATTDYIKANIEASLRTLSMETPSNQQFIELQRDVAAMMKHFEKVPALPEETRTSTSGHTLNDQIEFMKQALTHGRDVKVTVFGSEAGLKLKLPAAPKRPGVK